ncbi:MAG: Ig-like domain-containing protein [Patescibacteria group bacterium]|nr:Ig-like domain-containing protein [Patescibacteria group bacterium]
MFLAIASFVIADFVYAQADLGMEYGEQIGLSGDDPRIIIARVIQAALGFLGIIAVCLIMYAGWMWMVSEGNEEKIAKAKNILKNAIIGLVIILSSFAIASFVLNRLMGATFGGPSGGAGGGPSGGAGGGIGVLGSCSVESVYPEPSQQEVPRNTSIIVSFREEIDPKTICDDTNNNGVFCDAGDEIKKESVPSDNHVKLFKTSDPNSIITGINVITKDNKVFVFSPKAYLGSPSESVWYTVYLSNDIKKSDGGNVFSSCSRDYLEWQFKVSEKLDLTPPQVRAADKGGILPKPGSTKPRNSVIQINFNEAINPLTVSGNAEEVSGQIAVKCVGGVDCNPANDGYFSCGADTCLKGKFNISNQYKTIEFISDIQCGVNGCGEKIYCLPGDSQIKVEIKAAVLADCGADNCASRSPYNTCANSHCQDGEGKNYPLSLLPLAGVADMAFNSLDGNRDGDADGPASFYNENSPNPLAGDNYQWLFSISEIVDLSPPEITATSQENSFGEERLLSQGATGAHLAKPILIDFNKAMMSSSLRTGSIIINNGRDDIEHKLINLISAKSTLSPPEPDPELPGYWIAKNNIDNNDDGDPDGTRVEIRHSTFNDSTRYRAQVGSGVKDINQNCFKPSSGPGCAGNPSCCAGAPTAGSECP